MNQDKILIAFKTIKQANNASTQLLCREMNIHFNEAAEIMQILESLGAVGKFTGNKTRKLLITSEKLFINNLKK